MFQAACIESDENSKYNMRETTLYILISCFHWWKTPAVLENTVLDLITHHSPGQWSCMLMPYAV